MQDSHSAYMSLALELAARGRGTVSPNPLVGCVLVKENKIIGTGFHSYAGGPHAEVCALQDAVEKKISTEGAIAYVTLEPCCHHGQTPPCTQALISAGIKEVIVACRDPNPLVSGKGIIELTNAGIKIQEGVLQKQAEKMNEIFLHFIKYQRPFVIAKWAMSLDGKTITHVNDSKKISNEKSHQVSHQIRQQVDAILVGANTAIQDDPQLTVRFCEDAKKSIRQPLRIVLTSKGKLPEHLKLVQPNVNAKTLIATIDPVDEEWRNKMMANNVEVLVANKNSVGQVDVLHLLTELGKKGITSLLVEGGMQVHHSFFSENLVNQVHVYLAPVIIGDLPKKQMVQQLQHQQLENDFYFTANYGVTKNV